ncbi:hypothetical protein E4U52_007292, partial [Claviceps spartinae]
QKAEFEFQEGDDEVEPGLPGLHPTETPEEEQAGQQATKALDSEPSDSFPPTADGIRDAWLAVMRAKTESDFLKNWENLSIITYLDNTYVQWRDQFADYAIKSYLNFGVTVTSRVESSHHELKVRIRHPYVDLYELHTSIWGLVQARKTRLAEAFEGELTRRLIDNGERLTLEDVHCHWWLKASTSEEEALLTAYREPDPDVVRPRKPRSNEPKPRLQYTAPSGRILSTDEREGNAIAALVREVESQRNKTSSATSTRKKRGKRQEGGTQTQFAEMQSAILKLTGTVEALQASQNASQFASQYGSQAVFVGQHPPLPHHMNTALHSHTFPVAPWPSQHPGYQASQSTQDMAPGSIATWYHPAAQRPQ